MQLKFSIIQVPIKNKVNYPIFLIYLITQGKDNVIGELINQILDSS